LRLAEVTRRDDSGETLGVASGAFSGGESGHN
jgi:hypothetical protein